MSEDLDINLIYNQTSTYDQEVRFYLTKKHIVENISFSKEILLDRTDSKNQKTKAIAYYYLYFAKQSIDIKNVSYSDLKSLNIYIRINAIKCFCKHSEDKEEASMLITALFSKNNYSIFEICQASRILKTKTMIEYLYTLFGKPIDSEAEKILIETLYRLKSKNITIYAKKRNDSTGLESMDTNLKNTLVTVLFFNSKDISVIGNTEIRKYHSLGKAWWKHIYKQRIKEGKYDWHKIVNGIYLTAFFSKYNEFKNSKSMEIVLLISNKSNNLLTLNAGLFNEIRFENDETDRLRSIIGDFEYDQLKRINIMPMGSIALPYLYIKCNEDKIESIRIIVDKNIVKGCTDKGKITINLQR